jgi:hypothetical protein
MARDFNGSTDRLDWASQGNPTGSAFTASFWIDPDAYAHNSYYLCIHDSGDASLGFIVNSAGNTAISSARHGTTDYIWAATGVSDLLGGTWHHILVTSNGGLLEGSIAIYLDGVSQAITFTNGSGSETAHTGSWSLGGRIYSDTRNYDGSLGEVGVWDRVLSAGEIASLAAGATPDSFSTNLLFYYSAHTDTTTAKIGGAAATVDGTAYSSDHPLIDYISTLAGAIASAGTLVKSFLQTLAGAITPTGDLGQVYVPAGGTSTPMTLTGGLTPGGTIAKVLTILRTLTGALTPSGPPAWLWNIDTTLTGGLTPSGVLAKALTLVRTLVGGLTPSGALSYLKAFTATFTGGITPGGTVARVLNLVRTLAGAITPGGVLVKQLARTLTGGDTPGGVLGYLKAFVITLTGGITPGGTVAKALTLVRTLTGGITPGGTVAKALTILRTLTGGVTSAGTLVYSSSVVVIFSALKTLHLHVKQAVLRLKGEATIQPDLTAIDSGANGLSAIYHNVYVNGNTDRAWFNGINSYVDYYSAGLVANYHGDETTIIVRAKVNSSAVWTDSLPHYLFSMQPFDPTTGGSGALVIWKPNINNAIVFYYALDSGFFGLHNVPFSSLSWFTAGMTFSTGADEWKTYLDGIQVDVTDSPVTPFHSAYPVLDTCYLGALGLSALPDKWLGWMADGILGWGTAASPAQMLSIHTNLNAGTLTTIDLNTVFGAGNYAWWKLNEGP